MQNKGLIQYKWKNGVYDLKDMCELVQREEISEQDFFDITRYYYAVVIEQYNFDNI